MKALGAYRNRNLAGCFRSVKAFLQKGACEKGQPSRLIECVVEACPKDGVKTPSPAAPLCNLFPNIFSRLDIPERKP